MNSSSLDFLVNSSDQRLVLFVGDWVIVWEKFQSSETTLSLRDSGMSSNTYSRPPLARSRTGYEDIGWSSIFVASTMRSFYHYGRPSVSVTLFNRLLYESLLLVASCAASTLMVFRFLERERGSSWRNWQRGPYGQYNSLWKRLHCFVL